MIAVAVASDPPGASKAGALGGAARHATPARERQ